MIENPGFFPNFLNQYVLSTLLDFLTIGYIFQWNPIDTVSPNFASFLVARQRHLRWISTYIACHKRLLKRDKKQDKQYNSWGDLSLYDCVSSTLERDTAISSRLHFYQIKRDFKIWVHCNSNWYIINQISSCLITY